MQVERDSRPWRVEGTQTIFERAMKPFAAAAWRGISRLPARLIQSLSAFGSVDLKQVTRAVNGGEQRLWVAQTDGDSVALPSVDDNAGSLKRGALGKLRAYGALHSDPMLERYMLPGVVEVEPGDVVVDVGAYVGAFSQKAVRDGARRVMAFEPQAVNAECARLNTMDMDTVRVVERAVADYNGRGWLDTGADASDAHLGMDGDSVRVVRLDEWFHEHVPGLDRVDFLKVDAEGGELDVLRSMGDLDVRKVAVDAGEGGQPGLVASWLREEGFAVWRDGHLVYGRVGGGGDA